MVCEQVNCHPNHVTLSNLWSLLIHNVLLQFHGRGLLCEILSQPYVSHAEIKLIFTVLIEDLNCLVHSCFIFVTESQGVTSQLSLVQILG